MDGWRCIGCGRCYASGVPQCVACGPNAYVTSTKISAPFVVFLPVCGATLCAHCGVYFPKNQAHLCQWHYGTSAAKEADRG